MKCPICKNKIQGYPAISRTDNKTEICTECGITEAINSFMRNQQMKGNGKYE